MLFPSLSQRYTQQGIHSLVQFSKKTSEILNKYEQHSKYDTQSQTRHSIIPFYIYIQGIEQTRLSKATYNKYIWSKKCKKWNNIYTAVGTVKMFMEPSAKRWQSPCQPIKRQDVQQIVVGGPGRVWVNSEQVSFEGSSQFSWELFPPLWSQSRGGGGGVVMLLIDLRLLWVTADVQLR